MNVLVTKVESGTDSTLGYAWGTDESNGDEVFFAGDWRPMRTLAEVVNEGSLISVEVEAWQVIRRSPRITESEARLLDGNR